MIIPWAGEDGVVERLEGEDEGEKRVIHRPLAWYVHPSFSPTVPRRHSLRIMSFSRPDFWTRSRNRLCNKLGKVATKSRFPEPITGSTMRFRCTDRGRKIGHSVRSAIHKPLIINHQNKYFQKKTK